MHQHHYDIIVLGESLASRLAATLLAKAGKKVLTFSLHPPPFSPWLFNSVHLDQILDQLGGRNCLTSARKLQIITRLSRVELHGNQPLGEELRREFASCHIQVEVLLETLEAQGHRLESQLLTNGGLPLFDLAGRLRFRKKLLLSRYGFHSLLKPLSSLFNVITNPAARTFLEALFCGLAMAPLDRLTIAEGALLWSSACQPQGISRSALDDLLLRRYEQFHGGREPLDTIQTIDNNGLIQLKNAWSCSAETLVVGCPTAVSYLPESEQKLFRCHTPPSRWKTSPILTGMSPILAPRIILAEPQPLRITLTSTPTGTVGTAETQAKTLSEEELRSQLAEILPFASFGLSPLPPPEATADEVRWPRSSAFPGTTQRLKLKKNLLFCNGAGAVPHLGSTGEVMTGVALARYLLRTAKKQP